MTTRRDEALAQLAQQLQVPLQLLNLYPPAANHWTALLPDGWRVGIVSRGRRWGAKAFQDRINQAIEAEIRDGFRHAWEAHKAMRGAPVPGDWKRLLYGEWPMEPDSSDDPQPSCYKVPCQPWPEDE